MRVLSLFDGCGMAYQALKNIGIKVDKYYACEIDKWAIQIAKKNHPDIIHIGDINNVNPEDYKDIDLIVAGFPCQSFSIAGKRLNFEDERGQLFFKALEILKIVKPKHFIFENVASMRKDIQAEISRLIGVEPIKINSALVSAQTRKRLYWTNINVEQPEDRNIKLRSILFNTVDRKYYIKERIGKQNLCNFLVIPEATKKGYIKIYPKECFDYTRPNSKSRRGRKMKDKSNCLTTGDMNYMQYTIDHKIRRLTPGECERLQTLPYNYTAGVSNSQRYKMIGNGFTVAVIEHILKGML